MNWEPDVGDRMSDVGFNQTSDIGCRMSVKNEDRKIIEPQRRKGRKGRSAKKKGFVSAGLSISRASLLSWTTAEPKASTPGGVVVDPFQAGERVVIYRRLEVRFNQTSDLQGKKILMFSSKNA